MSRNHPFFDVLVRALQTDARQMVEEGHDPAKVLAEIEAVAKRQSLDALAALQLELWNRPSPAGFGYDEPNDFETISAGFPPADSSARFAGSRETLADRILASWQGRCAGCQLGKPVEGLLEPERVQQALRAVGSFPLSDYINPLARPTEVSSDAPEAGMRWWQHITRGRMQYVEPDDDIHYAITGLRTIEQFGVEFTAEQLIQEIASATPQKILFAAGINMVRTAGMGFKPPYTALFGNGFRQSLGATIRCDPFGWAAPANPALAAKMAFRDAACSQRRNGIYAGVFFATLLADVLSHGDPARAIRTATGYVPPKSRFAEMVAFVVDTCRKLGDWEPAHRVILDRYHTRLCRAPGVNLNHALPNAAICIMALLLSQGDFSKAITVSVMSGMDTDCNGATVGSIMGAALGTQGIPSQWTEPLQDTVRTELYAMDRVRISELGVRTYKVGVAHCRFA